MQAATASRPVCRIPLLSLPGESLNILDHGASLCKYRLIHCDQYIENEMLTICEFDELPAKQYCAISYIWRGKPIDGTEGSRGAFNVKGAEDGDPMSLDVLFHACIASLKKKVHYLWVDRLCIIQTSRNDKMWQIRSMYKIYKECALCLVLPGGIGRLVGLSEETEWIQRAWTLQEVMAPDDAMALFKWENGDGWFHGPVAHGDLEVVIRGESAMADVIDLCLPYLGGVMGGQTYFVRDDDETDNDSQPTQVRIKMEPILFGREPSHVLALLGVLWGRDADPVTPQAIWRSALMRVSSRPVDMVFSIMGLFDVSLDPNAFPDPNDRLGVTIALAQEILRKGGNASWLVASLQVPPEKRLSTFPMFPETKVDGKARVRVAGELKELAKVVDDEFLRLWSVREGPKGGHMDNMGYLTFSSKIIEVRPIQLHEARKDGCHFDQSPAGRRVFMEALDATVWEAVSKSFRSIDSSASSTFKQRTFAVYLGMALTNPYASQPTFHRYMETHTYLASIIQEHSPDCFHRTTNMILCHCFENFINTWEEREVCIGSEMH
ncbi:unnamed protein product [Somion occarium]|uniref:Heterokaryon incompatibility domain-containing protein n=1 Tax=Somion occarium TaxID=3059160 RepID=A0ABP1D8M2_9APHY